MQVCVGPSRRLLSVGLLGLGEEEIYIEQESRIFGFAVVGRGTKVHKGSE